MVSQFEKSGMVKHSYIDCVCGSAHHVVRISVDSPGSDWEPTFDLEVQIAPANFWSRVVKAFLYVFFPSRAQWDSSVLTIEGVRELETLIENFKDSHKKWSSSQDDAA